LIVEDSPIETEIYRKLLANDYDVTFKGSAEDALSSLKKEVFDLVLSDINLPGLSGPEMINQLKHGDKSEKPIVIVVSSDESGIKHALNAGANGWFLKPINTKTFPNSISVVIKKLCHKPASVITKPSSSKH